MEYFIDKETLNQIRKEVKLTTSDLGDFIGYTEDNIKNILYKDVSLNSFTILKCIEALSSSAEYTHDKSYEFRKMQDQKTIKEYIVNQVKKWTETENFEHI